ncbi:hypothetical protein MRX96_026118 [Rhipicephalus microplus]
MPKNCCAPLYKSNASRNPKQRYHELPSKENLRNAWLRNICQEGSDKGQPLGAQLQDCRVFASFHSRRLQGGHETQVAAPNSFANSVSVLPNLHVAF